jgi:hypothetical protein
MAETKVTKKEYRLLAKGFRTRIDKVHKEYKKGDLVSLSDSQYEAFKDQFEPKDAAQLKVKEDAEAVAKAKDDQGKAA